MEKNARRKNPQHKRKDNDEIEGDIPSVSVHEKTKPFKVKNEHKESPIRIKSPEYYNFDIPVTSAVKTAQKSPVSPYSNKDDKELDDESEFEDFSPKIVDNNRVNDLEKTLGPAFINNYGEENSSEEEDDIRSFYERRKKNPSSLKESRELAELKERLRHQEILIQKLIDEKSTPSVEKHTTPKTNKSNISFSIPNPTPTVLPEKEEIVKKRKMPDYSSMSEEMQHEYREKFRENFNKLIMIYKDKWKISITDVDINTTPLERLHSDYEKIVRTIIIYQKAMKFKVYFFILFAAIEVYFYGIKKNKMFKGFTRNQTKTLYKYEKYFLNFTESLYTGESDEWPSWLNCGITVITSSGTFLISQVYSLLTGSAVEDSTLVELDKFISPVEGKATLYDDGLLDVPEEPTGLQDPENLIKKGTTLVDLGILGKNVFSAMTEDNKQGGNSNNSNNSNNSSNSANSGIPRAQEVQNAIPIPNKVKNLKSMFDEQFSNHTFDED